MSPGQQLDQLGAVGIGIVHEPVDAPGQHGAQPLGRAQRIDAGAEIEDLRPDPVRPAGPTRAGFRRVLLPSITSLTSSGPKASVSAGTTSMISQTAPNVSPVAPPILR